MSIIDRINPGYTNPLLGADALTSAQFLISLIRNGIVIFFGLMIVFAVFNMLISGFRYVQSGGDADKVESAGKSIRYILIGLVVAFLGIIGVFIIAPVFTPTGSVELALRCTLGDRYTCTGGPAKVAWIDANTRPSGKECVLPCADGAKVIGHRGACTTTPATMGCAICNDGSPAIHSLAVIPADQCR